MDCREIFVSVYKQIYEIAERKLAFETRKHSWTTTDLVQEVFVKLSKRQFREIKSAEDCIKQSAKATRQILVDRARLNKRQKRRRDLQIALDFEAVDAEPSELLDIDECLEELHRLNPRQANVLELRYFGGLTLQEIAETLSISSSSVSNDIKAGLDWINRRLSETE